MAKTQLRVGRSKCLSKVIQPDDLDAFADAVGFHNPVQFVDGVAESSRIIDDAAIAVFGTASGDMNPLHFDEAFASRTRFKGRIAHGILTAGLIPSLIGDGQVVQQHLDFVRPVRPGSRITARARVTNVSPTRITTLETECLNEQGKPVITGYVKVIYDADHTYALECAARNPNRAHLNGLLATGLISAILGTKLPGEGTVYLTQHLVFNRQVFPGELLKAAVRIAELPNEDGVMTISTACVDVVDEAIITGYARVMYDDPSTVNRAA